MSERKASLKDLLEKFLGKKRAKKEFEVEILDLSGDRRYIKIRDKTIPRENILQIDPEKGIVVYIDVDNRVKKIELEESESEKLKRQLDVMLA